MFKTAKEVEQFIYSSYVNHYKDIPGGEDVHVRNPRIARDLLDRMGALDRKQKNIMITGSKGKGSLSVLVAKILQGHGYKIGLFTSPHLRDYRERIRIDGQAIPEADLIRIADQLQPHYDEIEAGLPRHKYVGPVGATAVMAMSWFHENKTDFNVVECGRGARYDDVNQIEGFTGGINKVFLEHVGPLGHNIDSVAHHKAGLIKKGMDAVYTAEQSKYPDRVLRYEARKFELPLYHYNTDFSAYDVRLTNEGTCFSVKGRLGDYRELKLSLLGRHQAENAALAIALCEGVLGRELDNEVLERVLPEIHWPGRMEILEKGPLVVLDGCISKESMRQVQEVVNFLEFKEIVTVLAIPEDKDYMGVLDMAREYKGKIIMTHADNDYLKFSPRQVEKARSIYPVEFRESVPEAMELAKSLARNDSLVLLLGTQSFIKDVKAWYGQDTLNI